MIMLPVAILSMPQGDDRTYMEQLYRQYYRLMLATAWRYVKEQAEVEDVVSDSCLAIIKNLTKVRALEQGKRKAYIVAIVKNTSINHINAHNRRDRVLLNGEDEAVLSVPDRFNIERKIELQDELEQVIHAIEQLAPKEREVMRMKYAMDMDDGEIARQTGLSENSIRQYIARARRHIKAALYVG